MLLKVKKTVRKFWMLIALSFFITGCYANDLLGHFNSAPKIVFVSSASVMGNMQQTTGSVGACTGGGISAANCICNTLATTANLQPPGGDGYRAWLSDSNTDALCNILGKSGFYPDCALGNHYVNYVDIYGTALFKSWDDLLNGKGPIAPIIYDEAGILMGAATPVWTATTDKGFSVVDGKPSVNSCNDWTEGAGASSGVTGNVGFAGSTWSAIPLVPGPGYQTTSSASPFQIYCFEKTE